MDILILGGSGGLGTAVKKYFPNALDWSRPEIDLGSSAEVKLAAGKLTHNINLLINCCGVNELMPFDQLQFADMMHLMTNNAWVFPNVVRALRKAGAFAFQDSGVEMECEGRAWMGPILINVISNAAHIPMTHSLAYNASKAAQEMITRQMARELKTYSIIGINPNKLKGTGMSRSIEKRVQALRGWTPEQADQYQRAALPAGVETPPSSLALFIHAMANPAHHPYVTGCIFPYGGPM